MKIQNFDALAVTDARRDLLTIAEAGLEVIDTNRVLGSMMRIEPGAGGGALLLGNIKVELAPIGKIIFIAIGKCAAEAAAVAELVLGDRIARGVVVDVKVCPVGLPQIKTFCGTHPLPSDENMNAAEAIVESLNGLTENDLVIFVVSGGGSTLLFLPEDRRDRNETLVFTALTDAGADIHEMNIVRKHMSLARGGYLAQYAYSARIVSFIFSDVIGDDLSSIASGPTVKDLTTSEDAAKILAKYDILKTCNIEKCGLVETPKDDKYFEHATNILAVSNVFALNAMRKAAEAMGYRVEIRSTALAGEAKEIARMVAESLHATPPRTALLWGGETTVTIKNGAEGAEKNAKENGSGGRNITVCAAGLAHIKEGEEILALASDGRDHGPYAGAICDEMTAKTAADAGADVQKYLADSNTYPLFEKIGQYVMTGDTGSNVSDLLIALKQ